MYIRRLSASLFKCSKWLLSFFAALDEFLDDFVESQLLYNDEIILAIVEKLSGIMERHAAVRIREYAELIVPTYSDIGFRSHFRLSRGSAEIFKKNVES